MPQFLYIKKMSSPPCPVWWAEFMLQIVFLLWELKIQDRSAPRHGIWSLLIMRGLRGDDDSPHSML